MAKRTKMTINGRMSRSGADRAALVVALGNLFVGLAALMSSAAYLVKTLL